MLETDRGKLTRLYVLYRRHGVDALTRAEIEWLFRLAIELQKSVEAQERRRRLLTGLADRVCTG